MAKSSYVKFNVMAVLSMCAALVGPATVSAQSIVQVPLVCESQGYEPEVCDTGESVVSGFLARRLSSTGCESKVGITPTGVTVVGGCRASFNLSLATTRQVYPLSCSSLSYQPTTCVAPQARAQGKNVRAAWVVERQSKSPCTFGQNFAISGDSIRVSNGCRATFYYTVE